MIRSRSPRRQNIGCRSFTYLRNAKTSSRLMETSLAFVSFNDALDADGHGCGTMRNLMFFRTSDYLRKRVLNGYGKVCR